MRNWPAAAIFGQSGQSLRKHLTSDGCSTWDWPPSDQALSSGPPRLRHLRVIPSQNLHPSSFILHSSSDPSQAVSKSEMRAARRLVNLATQSPNPYFSGISIGWPGRPSGTLWPTNRTANGGGVPISKLAPPAPSIGDPNPTPILKFARPTPIPNPPHPKNATTKNQATTRILTTQQTTVNTICRLL